MSEAVKTCRAGHDLTEENVMVRSSGAKQCRTCVRARQAEYRKRNFVKPGREA